jgi:hypothetical protein
LGLGFRRVKITLGGSEVTMALWDGFGGVEMGKTDNRDEGETEHDTDSSSRDWSTLQLQLAHT